MYLDSNKYGSPTENSVTESYITIQQYTLSTQLNAIMQKTIDGYPSIVVTIHTVHEVGS